MAERSNLDDSFYVYGLVDPKIARDTGDDLSAVFYVGKGKGQRWRQHSREVQDALVVSERLGSKVATIRRILERGEPIPALILAEGIETEQDAYQAEQLAMSLVEALLRPQGRSLTNAIPGHGQWVTRIPGVAVSGDVKLEDRGYEPVPQKSFTRVSVDIEPQRRNVSRAPFKHPVLLVKGTRDTLALFENRVIADSELPAELQPIADQLTVLESVEVERERRGWDPDAPWEGDEAGTRACRYWPIAATRVASWIRGDEDRPHELLLGIPNLAGQTVVRYAWRIDYRGKWEYYPEGRRWGVPLGEPLLRHELLNTVLVENRDGSEVENQVLLNHAAGWRHLL
ncbi:GIY-YIG nuclease family protein [Pseudoclavibacter helvolus]|uniref:GIY-YIG nuclease family protein n=1 Tax=Pseudoclavibacter helvolus TaxID=255205 RepID=UPI0024ADC0F6|nr:GIY-YIG nuclease family protein [Pseudoclavibacter helvolus]